MRKAIRTKLMTKISNLNNRVFEPHMAGPKQSKPYAVVLFADESSGNIREGFDQLVEVWLYIDRTTFVTLDTLAAEVIKCLNGKDLTTTSNKVFSLRYTGSSRDVYDPEWEALTRRLDFVTESIHAR